MSKINDPWGNLAGLHGLEKRHMAYDDAARMRVEGVWAEKTRPCSNCGREIAPEHRVDVKEFEDLCYSCYKLKPKHVCVDFDGVLAEYTGWKGPDHLGDPRPGVKHFLQMINDEGMKIIILTTRDPGAVHSWLIDHHLHDLVDRVTRQKPPALVYLDDRAVCFRGNFVESWATIKRFVPYWREG